ncbi:uncharacterized protein PV07_09616 [Cladophialophora immunda]|uniref:Uncharacterized protein n=1 Tax=Cladophialophora immunda TaxID=569365 RepID=A0A0D2CSI7_9EURO|nr:uncharacterized protein PV07_09616 [Cladophialophora immunda]KIW26529.1 hypothetical protein PV07_09616 [Cladophialophora immunda]OQV02379.1 hypothetical protein CLAIMM_07584 [Cladophialophora immunda]
MSTSTPPNGRAANDDVGGSEHLDPNHLSLPTFHSVRESSNERDGRGSRTESTASGSASRRSRSRNPDLPSSRLLERLSFGGSNARSDGDPKSKEKEKEREKEKEKAKENDAPRHNVSRRSGGFLLEPVSNSKRVSRASPVPPTRKDPEGKRNSGDSELTLVKRRHRTNGHASSSFKSSPLAGEVKQDPIIYNYPSSDQLVPGTDVRRSLSSSHNGSQFTGIPASASRNVEVQRTPVAMVGFDNDPAQIVNMALSLSEGRRRLASGRRYVSTEQGERRVVSAASTSNPNNTVRRRSIAPFLATNRQSSQGGSPKRHTSSKHRDSNTPATPVSVDVSVTEVVPNLDIDPDFVDQISPATAARVEKAKVYFELAHEHRRLLPHLPPIRKPGTQLGFTGPEAMQKAYNPLQYVRNRKLRIWEKTPINSEAEGWHDVQKVRAWVDAVVSSHPDTQHDSLECVRLPPLDLRSADTDREDTDDSPDEPKSTVLPRVLDQLHPKPTRPRSDWVTHPGDLIADAYWLEQGMNKTKIQDRDNNLIYPPNTHFTFSGWRNQTPVNIPTRLQQSSPPLEPQEDSFQETPSSALPELPTFKSAHHAHKSGRHGRRRDIIRDSVHGKSGSSSRERSRIRKKLFQDSSDSDYSASMSSDDAGIERGRNRLRRKRHETPVNNGAEKGSHSQSKQTSQAFGHGHGDSSQGSSAPTSKRTSMDHTGLNKLFRVDSLKKASPLTRSRNRQDSSRPRSVQVPIRSSLEHEHQPRASTEYDTTTAPNSPNGVEWPSIAINLSPPPSRPSSPSKNPISTILHPFHRKPHKGQGQTSTTDFAHVPPVQSVHEHELEKHVDSPDSRGQSPMTRGLSSLSKNQTHSTEPDDMTPQSSIEHRHSTASKVSTRSTTHAGSDHSRIRAIFKGGRIAEIVGNEVSRVGDFIWKRDLPIIYRHRGSASEGSIRSYDGSDSEIEQHHRHHHHQHQQQQHQQQQNGTILKTPPPLARSRSSTISSTKSDHVSPVATKTTNTGNDRPRYNNPNLPSFTSPFQKDRERQEKQQGYLAPDDAATRGDSADHISRLAAQRRSASHSPRLAALPRLDTGAPTTPNEVSRQKSYGFGAALDLSRSRDASDQLNSVIGPVTGLSGLRPSRSAGDLSKMGGSDLGQEDGEPADVTWRDIERAQVLLYTSTVKAREIGRRAEDSGEELPPFLLESLTPENKALHSAKPLRVKKRERHIVAAQNIMKTLEGHSFTFNKKLHSFTTSLIPALHSQLQILEDQVENNMTPQVRITADSAGELSMKLSTTSTLAVKELNDSIEVAFRRKRRGPIRLFRKLWFAGIEWTVVGLLWLIWAVVSVVRFTLGTGRCVVKGVRWLFWID